MKIEKLNGGKVVTVAYRIVRGAAKAYPYYGGKVYAARYRRDGVPTFRPVREVGPDRRSERLAHKDAQEFAQANRLPFLPRIRLGRFADLPTRDELRNEIYSNDNH